MSNVKFIFTHSVTVNNLKIMFFSPIKSHGQYYDFYLQRDS